MVTRCLVTITILTYGHQMFCDHNYFDLWSPNRNIPRINPASGLNGLFQSLTAYSERFFKTAQENDLFGADLGLMRGFGYVTVKTRLKTPHWDPMGLERWLRCQNAREA